MDSNQSLAPESLKLPSWDAAVFASDVLRAQGQHKDFDQTAKAMSLAYGKIMTAIHSYFDVAGFEPSLAPDRKLLDKKRLYQFSTAGNFPPHLELVPTKDSFTQEEIFLGSEYGVQHSNVVSKAAAYKINIVAGSVFEWASPRTNGIAEFRPSSNFREIEENHLRSRKAIYAKPSVGDLTSGDMPWYSDAIFAQQNFNGSNPTTIELAGAWTSQFLSEAKRQKLEKLALLLDEADGSSLYVQDCSYFRAAFGIKEADATMSDPGGYIVSTSRWACASVTLFHLDGKGRLHPLAIVIDYKGTMEKSVVIFNQRLTADEKSHNEATDWAWRYAKTCSQVSDWIRHELAVHLTNTHLIEEPIIIASQRTLLPSHIVYKILSTHWDKTLSLNASARSTLVPSVIVPSVAFTAEQVKNFVNYSYQNFDFEGNYIPADLERRGFPFKSLGDIRCCCSLDCDANKSPSYECTAGCGPECHQKCDPKFVNYTYARNMKLMWTTLRAFVKGYLATDGYTEDEAGDKKLSEDKIISDWVTEIKSAEGANLKKFPNITSVKELIDAVTMCIHIASPQHTAVNYLQQYYLSFVVNKPPALCSAPPTSLSELFGYGEQDLIKALPVQANRDADWLLASHLPALLSQTVTKDLNLVTYAVNVYCAAKLVNDAALMKVAETFCRELWVLGDTFAEGDKKRLPRKGVFTCYSEELAEGFPRYTVMDPVVTAISILI